LQKNNFKKKLDEEFDEGISLFNRWTYALTAHMKMAKKCKKKKK